MRPYKTSSTTLLYPSSAARRALGCGFVQEFTSSGSLHRGHRDRITQTIRVKLVARNAVPAARAPLTRTGPLSLLKPRITSKTVRAIREAHTKRVRTAPIFKVKRTPGLKKCAVCSPAHIRMRHSPPRPRPLPSTRQPLLVRRLQFQRHRTQLQEHPLRHPREMH